MTKFNKFTFEDVNEFLKLKNIDIYNIYKDEFEEIKKEGFVSLHLNIHFDAFYFNIWKGGDRINYSSDWVLFLFNKYGDEYKKCFDEEIIEKRESYIKSREEFEDRIAEIIKRMNENNR